MQLKEIQEIYAGHIERIVARTLLGAMLSPIPVFAITAYYTNRCPPEIPVPITQYEQHVGPSAEEQACRATTAFVFGWGMRAVGLFDLALLGYGAYSWRDMRREREVAELRCRLHSR